MDASIGILVSQPGASSTFVEFTHFKYAICDIVKLWSTIAMPPKTVAMFPTPLDTHAYLGVFVTADDVLSRV